MPNYDWRPSQRISAPQFSPNAGLAMASRAFGSINDQIQAEDEAAALALYRDSQTAIQEKKLAFEMGAPEREKQKLRDARKLETDKAQMAMGITTGLANMGANKFFDSEQVKDA